jgi:hypothetical protein
MEKRGVKGGFMSASKGNGSKRYGKGRLPHTGPLPPREAWLGEGPSWDDRGTGAGESWEPSRQDPWRETGEVIPVASSEYLSSVGRSNPEGISHQPSTPLFLRTGTPGGRQARVPPTCE